MDYDDTVVDTIEEELLRVDNVSKVQPKISQGVQVDVKGEVEALRAEVKTLHLEIRLTLRCPRFCLCATH